jgi:hypothetical protein
MKGQTSKNWRAMLVSVLWTRLTLENWRAKLISLVLATTVWYLIKKNITTTDSSAERPSPTPVTETRGERAEATVESYRVVPEWRMSGVGYDVDLRVRHVGFVTINDRRFDHRIISAVGDQYGLAYLR